MAVRIKRQLFLANVRNISAFLTSSSSTYKGGHIFKFGKIFSLQAASS